MSVQRFGRCALRPSSGISFRTQEPSCRNRDLYPAMDSRTRAEYPYGSNKGLCSKFRGKSRLRQEGSRIRKEIPEEGRRAHRPKRCTDINEDEDNSPKNRNTTKGL